MEICQLKPFVRIPTMHLVKTTSYICKITSVRWELGRTVWFFKHNRSQQYNHLRVVIFFKVIMKLLKVIEYTNAHRAAFGEGSIALYKKPGKLCQLVYPYYMYEQPPAT